MELKNMHHWVKRRSEMQRDRLSEENGYKVNNRLSTLSQMYRDSNVETRGVS